MLKNKNRLELLVFLKYRNKGSERMKDNLIKTEMNVNNNKINVPLKAGKAAVEGVAIDEKTTPKKKRRSRSPRKRSAPKIDASSSELKDIPKA